MREIFYRRSFLNRPRFHGGAFVLAKVKYEGYDSGADWISADVRLSDCFKTVVLDFDASDRADRRNALHKARLLRDVLTAFCAAMEEACAEADRHEAEHRRATRKRPRRRGTGS
jgi:hypothetical protein